MHHSSKLCFPAIPFKPLALATFDEMTMTENISWSNLSYTEVCRADAMREATDGLVAVGLGPENAWSPVALVLRPAEAIDAVKAFAASGIRADSGAESAAALVCGVTMVGGVLYSLFFLPVLVIAWSCVPLFFAMAEACFGTIVCCFTCRRRGRRQSAVGIASAAGLHRHPATVQKRYRRAAAFERERLIEM